MTAPQRPPPELTVGQLSARSGVAVSALHFYEAQGLISARRTAGNQRRYPRAMLRRIAFIRASQRVGIPLAQIRDALATLPAGRTPSRRDWARLSAAWIHRPWEAPRAMLVAAGVELGRNYPRPIVSLRLSRELALEVYHRTRCG